MNANININQRQNLCSYPLPIIIYVIGTILDFFLVELSVPWILVSHPQCDQSLTSWLLVYAISYVVFALFFFCAMRTRLMTMCHTAGFFTVYWGIYGMILLSESTDCSKLLYGMSFLFCVCIYIRVCFLPYMFFKLRIYQEQLRNRVEDINIPAPAIISPANYETLPVTKYIDQNAKECTICQETFVIDENIKTLPCFHVFHPICIDTWLSRHTTCPICRFDLRRDENV
jgi:hypothetical protein